MARPFYSLWPAQPVGLSGTLTVRVYVVQVHSLHQTVGPAPRESNSRHPTPVKVTGRLCACAHRP